MVSAEPTRIAVDARGNTWRSAALAPSELQRLAAAHASWATASDADIAAAKRIIATAANVCGTPAEASMLGMACADFLYLYNSAHQHFFVHVHGDPAVNGDPAVLIYEGECDMQWSMSAPFAIVQMQIDMALAGADAV